MDESPVEGRGGSGAFGRCSGVERCGGSNVGISVSEKCTEACAVPGGDGRCTRSASLALGFTIPVVQGRGKGWVSTRTAGGKAAGAGGGADGAGGGVVVGWAASDSAASSRGAPFRVTGLGRGDEGGAA